MDRQKTLLLALAVLLLAVGARVVLPWLTGTEEAPGVFGFSLSKANLEVPELTRLELAELEKKPGEYSPGRDPFRFYVAPKPPPKPAPKPPPKPAPKPRPAANAGNNRPVPKPPAVDVRYLGSFGPDASKIAVFTDGEDIFNVQKGGILKLHFVVEAINYESADLKFVNFPNVPPKRLAAGG